MTRGSYDSALLEEWVSACEDADDRLTPWERDFIADMRRRLDDEARLSDNQIEKLEQIYAARTP